MQLWFNSFSINDEVEWSYLAHMGLQVELAKFLKVPVLLTAHMEGSLVEFDGKGVRWGVLHFGCLATGRCLHCWFLNVTFAAGSDGEELPSDHSWVLVGSYSHWVSLVPPHPPVQVVLAVNMNPEEVNISEHIYNLLEQWW